MNAFSWTEYQSKQPVTKEFRIDQATGEIVKSASAQMSEGTAVRREGGITNFAEALRNADPHTAFGYGLFAETTVPVASEKNIKEGRAPANSKSRSLGNVAYANSPGVLLLDYDPPKDPHIVQMTPQNLLDALCEILEEFRTSAMIVRGSISAGVHRQDKSADHALAHGLHIYVPVQSAADIPRFGKALYQRLWLAGYGRIELSKAGSFLERTVIDAAVFSPERLDFVGRPVLGQGLIFSETLFEMRDGKLLDTTMLPSLTKSEQETYSAYVQGAKNDPALVASAYEIRLSRKKACIKELSTSMDAASAEAEVSRFWRDGESHRRELPYWFKLEFAYQGIVTVDEVMRRANDFDNEPLADPLEGPEYGTSTAMFYANLNGGKPFINSFAHGGCSYTLKPKPISVEETTAIIDSDDKGELGFDALIKAAMAGLKPSDFDTVLRGYATKHGKKLGATKRDVQEVLINDDPEAYRRYFGKVKATSSQGEDAAETHNQEAKRVIDYLGRHLYLYCRNDYYVWDDCGVWRKEDTKMMFSRVKQAMEDLDIPIRSAGHVTSVMDLVSGEIIKPPYLVFHRQDKEFSLNFLNGTLDVDVNDRTVQFRKHNPTDFFTTQLQCDYVPGATAPVFMSYLDSVFINDEDREEKKQLLLEVWFRAMFKSLTLARQLECGVMLLGNGHNGKSVYTRAIETFLGEENVSNVEPEMMDSRFQQGHMAGKHANINHELAEGITLKDAALKRLISGESITVEEKNKPAYNTRSSALVLMGSNHLPHSRDHSDALTRRFRMIYFNRKISEEEKDVRLGAKIAKEFPGIVNAALAVGMELLQRGSHIQPASSVEAVSGWKRDCDIVHQFREDCLVVKPGLTESFPAIYEAFKTWATENHGGTRNVTGNSLSRRLRQDGAISRSPNKNAQRQVMFTGCKLITNAASYDIPNNVTLFKHQEAKA